MNDKTMNALRSAKEALIDHGAECKDVNDALALIDAVLDQKSHSMRDTIDMAREAGYMRTVHGGAEVSMASMDCLKAFEALARADERKAAQAESEADEVIIEYHEATIKRLEAGIKAKENT